MKTFSRLIALSFIVISSLLITTGCSTAQPFTREEVKDFYTQFVQEASSLPPDALRAAYKEISEEAKTSKNNAQLRENALNRIKEVDPDLFNKIYLAPDNSNFDQAASLYSTIVLLSLNTNGEPVSVDIDMSGISDWKKTADYDFPIVEIDRKKIYTSLTAEQGLKISAYHKDALSTLRIGDVQGEMKIIPDSQPLWEIGEPNKNVN